MNNIVLLFLEKVCEAIYFSLFMIYGKNLKEKRLLFVGIMIFEYLALTSIIEYNVWLQIIYTFMSFINLKVLYREKAQITDIFLFMTASIVLIIVGAICVKLSLILNLSGYNDYFKVLLLNRILIFLILFLFRNKINVYYKKFYKRWNRHTDTTKIKSLTLRNISIIVFNLMFYIINIGLTYIILTK